MKNNILQFCADLEMALIENMQYILFNTENLLLKDIITDLINLHKSFINGIEQINTVNIISKSDYNDLVETLIISNNLWEQATSNIADNKTNVKNLTTIWMLISLIDKSAQLYQQAAINSAYPDTKLFYNFVAEFKVSLRKKLDSIMRVLYNDVWAQVGFAPFKLGRD